MRTVAVAGMAGVLVGSVLAGCERGWHSGLPLERHASIVSSMFARGMPVSQVESRLAAMDARPGTLRSNRLAAGNPDAKGSSVFAADVLGPGRFDYGATRELQFYFDSDDRLEEVWTEVWPVDAERRQELLARAGLVAYDGDRVVVADGVRPPVEGVHFAEDPRVSVIRHVRLLPPAPALASAPAAAPAAATVPTEPKERPR